MLKARPLSLCEIENYKLTSNVRMKLCQVESLGSALGLCRPPVSLIPGAVAIRYLRTRNGFEVSWEAEKPKTTEMLRSQSLAKDFDLSSKTSWR